MPPPLQTDLGNLGRELEKILGKLEKVSKKRSSTFCGRENGPPPFVNF
jgi:hypothetical protein